MKEKSTIPLCVDLDGTLVRIDTLYQALFLLLRKSPLSLFQWPKWWARGRAFFKEQVMQRVELDAATLPYQKSFLNELRAQHAAGRDIILTTAANHRVARAVVQHLGIFSEYLASDAEINLSGAKKRDAIRSRFSHFAYAGDCKKDFPIWAVADEIILVNPSRVAEKKYVAQATQVFEDRPPFWKAALKAMRPAQWLKNILVFAPLFLAHRFAEPYLFLQASFAFLSFGFAASSIYLLNDLFDLSADQHHPRKKARPFACGDLSIASGLLLVPLFVLLSFLSATFLPGSFLLVLLSYYLLTTLYSWRIKQIPLLDVLLLAILYIMRVFAGSAATGVPSSIWFIAFSLTLFLSLALLKRFAEMREISKNTESEENYHERGYRTAHLQPLFRLGILSGCLTVLVLALYANSSVARQLYAYPARLWVLCPLLFYWILRVWNLAKLGKMYDDPVAFAIRDPQTYLLGSVALFWLFFAM
jgi:4-hydroxybenzoate polyprenyltransferase